MPIWCAQQKITHLLPSFVLRIWQPDSDTDQLWSMLNRGGDISSNITFKRFGDRIWINSFQSGLATIHLDSERVAGRNDPVLDLHQSWYFRNRVNHLRSQLGQKLLVFGEELNLDRLWYTG